MAHDPRTFVEISKTRELQKLTQEKKPVRLSQTRGRGVKMTPQRKIPFSFFFVCGTKTWVSFVARKKYSKSWLLIQEFSLNIPKTSV